MKRHLRIFKDRSHGHGELSTASTALMQAITTMRIKGHVLVQLVGAVFVDDATLGTNRAVFPENSFKVFPRYCFVLELRGK